MSSRSTSAGACAAIIAGAMIVWCAGCANPFAFTAVGVQDDQEITKASGEKISPTTRAPSGDVAAAVLIPTPAPPPAAPTPQSPPQPIIAAYANAAPQPTTTSAPTIAPPNSAAITANGADPQQLTALLDEVQALGALDPEAQRALLENLRQCDPKLWPQMVRQFKTVLAYRKQMAAEAQAAKSEPPASAALLTSALTQIAASATASGDHSPAILSTKKSTESPDSATQRAADVRAATTAAAATAAKLAASAKSVADKPAATAAKIGTAPETHSTPPAAIVAAASSTAAPEAWQTQLTSAILELESQNASGGTTSADIDRQINLRILYLAAGRRDDALRPISGMTPEQQQFWTKELYGLATLRDSTKQPDLERRATEATLHLREAAAQLGDLATPVVRNLAFCKEVTSFGVYTKFPNYEFTAGEEALIYCELENLKAASTDRGYHTAVKGTYEILDSHGSRMTEQEFPASDDFCANARRDFFILYHIWIPKQIAAGSYTLQLTIEDTQTNRVGQSTMQFKVK
ncbi:MAG TPA: hypothetical protein VHX65_17025 [Pirellulales bacterium]|jgi:hypothetical protein|nr:hypothetical protein [Pirellulales bacterium]